MCLSDLHLVGEAAAAAGPCLSVEVDQARDEAALLSMAWALAELFGNQPPNTAVDSSMLAPGHGVIVRRWIEHLVAADWLEPGTGEWRRNPPSRAELDMAWQRALALAPNPGAGGSLTRFFAGCAEVLPQLLTGDVLVQSLLFDDDSIPAEVYQANEASRYTNAVAAAAVRRHCCNVLAEGRTPAILEIGGGVGGTTDVVLDELTDLPLRYHFTDVGDWFTYRAEERWAGRAGLTTGIFDINDTELQQRDGLGALSGELDVVLAANVMHNATDVPKCLGGIAGHCRPGAILVLIETGTEHLPLLISMRFLMKSPPSTEGIGGERFAEGRILLTSSQWSEALESNGWQLQEVLPGTNSNHPVARYDQHVWLAVCGEGI
ncbi:MAG: class I SAM-dependent methyltransferase [Propionibacteriaceae bacterium]|nr:class I SAM-dependent methyltransferase [Propionibacteriaceae bacterium]